MTYTARYKSEIGELLLVSDGKNLTGLYIKGQKYYFSSAKDETEEKDDLPIFRQTKGWLDRYFCGERVTPYELRLKPQGSDFRQSVWKLLCEIPYGETTTYGEIARKIAEMQGRKSMSAQAVGGAVGHNPISIIIPCHRVIGADGSLTGYAGGIDKKIKLLEIERIL